MRSSGAADCGSAPSRLGPGGRRETFELRLPHQAYGLLFSFEPPRLLAGAGRSTLLLAATDDTPEGEYRIPLEAAYVGYRPACSTVDKLLGSCAQAGVAGELKHAGIGVPPVRVRVVQGDPSARAGQRRLEEAREQERQQKAAQRAQELAAVLSELDAEMKGTFKLLRRRKYEEVRARVDKLAALFEPLNSLSVEETGEPVLEARARFDELREGLAKFENKVFEAAFKRLNDPDNAKVSEAKLMDRVARRHRISARYLTQIYTARADEIQQRLEALAQARLQAQQAELAAREKHCGPLPTGADRTVAASLSELQVEGDLKLGECFTPRLTDRDCWMLQCDFTRSRLVAIELPRKVTKHRGKFFLRHGKVVDHQAVK